MKLLPILLLFCASFAAAQQATFSAAILNRDITAVPQLEKLEIGVALPEETAASVRNFLSKARVSKDQLLNPFVEWDIDIEALFVHESGRSQKIDAFFYREYERDSTIDSWRELPTRHPFRIRFAPPLPGKWTATVSMKLAGDLIDAKERIEFTVLPTNNRGNIHVHANGRNLALSDSVIFPVGTNFPAPMKGVRIYHTGAQGQPEKFAPEEMPKVTRLHEWLLYHRDIAEYRETGGKYIRTLQTAWSSLLEFEEKGNYYDRQPYAWEQDRLLEFCEANGMYVHFNLMQQEPIMKYANYYMGDWDFSQYEDAGRKFYRENPYPSYAYSGNRKKEAYEMFLDEEDLRYHEQRMRYYISRYGYSTSITLFELLSEPWHLNQPWPEHEPMTDETPEGDLVRKAITNYHSRMAKFIRQDLQRSEHPIAIEVFFPSLFDGKFLDSAAFSPDVDVISINPYSNTPDKLIISKSTPNNEINTNENSMYRSIWAVHDRMRKPVMIAEGGPADAPQSCNDSMQWRLDMAGFGFNGIAGFNSWRGWADGQEDLWPVMKDVQNFWSRPDVIAVLSAMEGRWTNGRQAERIYRRDDKAAKELQYYLSGSGGSAVGYVKNRTANVIAMGNGAECADPSFVPGDIGRLRNITWNAGTRELYVDGLKPGTTYTIRWIDALSGEVVADTRQRLNRRRFLLKFPELKVTDAADFHPQYWFIISPAER
jgi:hypothetical protein